MFGGTALNIRIHQTTDDLECSLSQMSPLELLAVVSIDGGRIAVRVDPPPGVDLHWIYRAAISVHWNPEAQQLENQCRRENSQLASFDRISRAAREELGFQLQASSGTEWRGITEAAREVIENEITR